MGEEARERPRARSPKARRACDPLRRRSIAKRHATSAFRGLFLRSSRIAVDVHHWVPCTSIVRYRFCFHLPQSQQGTVAKTNQCRTFFAAAYLQWRKRVVGAIRGALCEMRSDDLRCNCDNLVFTF